MIELIATGPQASVQDLGRRGYLAQGVGCAGAMDPVALELGNRMLGNDPGAAGIEFTYGGFEILFHADTAIALTGADCGARLNGRALPGWSRSAVRAGDRLVAGMARAGMRACLTVAGGIAVPAVLGSSSTDMKGGFGGHHGRALQPGDRLAAGPGARGRGAEFSLDTAALSGFYDAAYPAEVPIRFLPATEYPLFTAAARAAFAAEPWVIQPDSNRVGYRLKGPVLETTQKVELFSHGILPGTIQVPPSGQPAIQLADANTCGGYPKIGVVIAADLWRIGQARLGDRLRFAAVDRDQALAARQDGTRAAAAFHDRLAAGLRVIGA